jgi:hypothetical protein
MATFSMQGSVQIVSRLVDGAATLAANANRSLVLSNGTGSGQANGYHTETLSIAAGQTSTIDLRALAISALGATGTLALAAVKQLLVMNHSEKTAITVSPAATDGWANIGGSIPLGVSGTLSITSPVGGIATSASSKAVTITNGDTVHSLNGNTTSGQTAITGLSSTASLEAGMLVAGTGVPAGATVTSITSGTAVSISAAATATGTAVALTFKRPNAVVEIHVAGVKV